MLETQSPELKFNDFIYFAKQILMNVKHFHTIVQKIPHVKILMDRTPVNAIQEPLLMEDVVQVCTQSACV